MKLQERLSILSRLGEYLSANPAGWQLAKQKASLANAWFVPQFIDFAVDTICRYYLDINALKKWVEDYKVPEENSGPMTVGLTMAGNIPLVGFHDWLTIFIAGHRQRIKPSGKDSLLIGHIIETLSQWDPRVDEWMKVSERINDCDAYIATGSNNSGRYFEYYFGKYPNIIRKNRTSAAILTGQETPQELQNLAKDILLYFGLGCRNVSKIYVPNNYGFEPLLNAFEEFNWMKDHDKYRNNYDYQLSIMLLNGQYYMSNDVLLLIENESLFSPIAQLHYEFYDLLPETAMLYGNMADSLQCVCGSGGYGFGQAQKPSLTDYSDGVDTLSFCLQLKK